MSAPATSSAATAAVTKPLRVGIVGFGALGQYIYRALVLDAAKKIDAEICFIWNRSPAKIREHEFVDVVATPISSSSNATGTDQQPPHRVPEHLIITDMAEIAARGPCDILLEVCHPDVLAANIEMWLQSCRAVYVGSPTGFADSAVLTRTLAAAAALRRQIFVPCGALWGVQDIAKMGARGGISALHVTMRKPAASTRLEQPLQAIVEEFEREGREAEGDPARLAALRPSAVVYDGPVGKLCPLAPNNVNTMACAALASGVEIGFANARGTLIIERDSISHIIEIAVDGKPQPGYTEPLRVRTTRVNPCAAGAVTGMATYVSFVASLAGCVATMRAEAGAPVVATGLRFC